jgi:arsenate reductase (thioredoxin)
MKELGVDISAQRSKPLQEFEGQHFDFIITVCDKAREECPAFSAEAERLHWPFPDPAGFTETGEAGLEVFPKIAGSDSCEGNGFSR